MIGQSGTLPEWAKRDWWPEIMTWFGGALLVVSLFHRGDDGRYLVVSGMLFVLRGDVLAIRRELRGWRRL